MSASGALTITGSTVSCATPIPNTLPPSQSTHLVLDYTQQTDLWNGQALVVDVWSTWLPAQTFTTTGGLVALTLRQAAAIYTGDEQHAIVAWRFNLDNGAATEPIARVVWNQGAGMPALGELGGTAYVALAAGQHQVMVQYFSYYPTPNTGHTPTLAYLRKSTTLSDGSPAPYLGQVEFLRLQAIELGG